MLPHDRLKRPSERGHVGLSDGGLGVGVEDAAAMDHQDQDGGRAGSLSYLQNTKIHIIKETSTFIKTTDFCELDCWAQSWLPGLVRYRPPELLVLPAWG